MRLLVVFLLALAPGLARAEGEFQSWSALFAQYRPTEGGLAGWLDLQPRRGSSTILLLRPAIGWGLGKNLTIHAGYAYIHTFVDMGDDGKEHRTWEQAVYNHPVSHELKLQGRVRLEQRFIDGDDGTGHRIRLLARGQYGPRAGALQLVIWDELFVHLNDTTRIASGFNQNRAFFGLGTDTKVKGLRIEAGYQNIYFEGGRLDHAIAVNVFALVH